MLNWGSLSYHSVLINRMNLFFLYFVYPLGKPKIPHFLCCQGFAVGNYGFTLDASDLGHPRLSLNEGIKKLLLMNKKRFSESVSCGVRKWGIPYLRG